MILSNNIASEFNLINFNHFEITAALKQILHTKISKSYKRQRRVSEKVRYSTCCTLNSGSSDDTSFAKLTQNVQLFEKLDVKIAQIKTI